MVLLNIAAQGKVDLECCHILMMCQIDADLSCLQRPVALRVPDDVNLPEELTPLAEALEQAQQRVDQVTALREALEWKVCKSPAIVWVLKLL